MSSHAPFSQSCQLNTSLEYHEEACCSEASDYEWKHHKPLGTLPGHPDIILNDPCQLKAFLAREFVTPELDQMAPKLWLLTTQSSANVSALHQQRLKGREILITEDPRLHLLWIDNRVFLKPLPEYLLSHGFWIQYLSATKFHDAEHATIRKSALGYLRTYYHLIRHESDFDLAIENRLIPRHVTWRGFALFRAELASIQDSEVSRRYAFGEIRLSRLNLFTKIFLRRFNYQEIHWQYSERFSRFYGPLLFVFGLLSVALSAMQVEMAVEQVTDSPWKCLWTVYRWWGVVAVLCILGLALSLILLFLAMMLNELSFALRALWKIKRHGSRHDAGGGSVV